MIDENSTFGGFLTTIGEAKQANANALKTPWKLTHLLLGDANGSDPVPDPDQAQLVNQVYRAAINQLSIDPDNPGILIAEVVLPPTIGGWWIRELGIEDEDGDFVAVANCPPSYKPLLAQGSGRNQVVRMHLILSNTANVELKVDPSVVLATREYVDTQRNEHEEDDKAHADDQILLSAPVAQAPNALNVAQALSELSALTADSFQNIAVFEEAGEFEFEVPEVLKSGRRRPWVTVVGAGAAGAAGLSHTIGEEGATGGAAHKLVDLTGVDKVTLTIGRGGNPVTDAQGESGGTSSFGSYVSATGGEGGRPGSHESAALAGEGIGGDINIVGNHGSATPNDSDLEPLRRMPRAGKPGPLGGGAAAGQRFGSNQTVPNTQRHGRFAGASGCGGTTANTAGSGAHGMIIVRW